MPEKKGDISIGKLEASPPFALLSQYDELAAEELEDLRSASAAISEEMKALKAELGRLKALLETGSNTGRLKALYAEQALHEVKHVELQDELQRLSKEADALRLSVVSEEEYNRITAEIGELKGQQEGLSREFASREKEAAVYAQEIAELETQISDVTVDLAKNEAELKLHESEKHLVDDLKAFKFGILQNTGIKPDSNILNKAITLESKSNNNTSLIKAHLDEKAGPPKRLIEIALIQERLIEKDAQALAHARDFFVQAQQEYGLLGKDINEFLHLRGLNCSLMQELEENRQHALSLETENKALQDAATGSAAALEELSQRNSEAKARAASLEAEISRCRNQSEEYAEEEAKGAEMSRKKEEVRTEFIDLFVNKAALEARALTAARMMRVLKDLAKGKA